ncbi:MAG: serine/threonine protein kinase [Rhizobacter sp.]|nr:serine/threonine protein kinase [Rhizobacter sp.]
MLVFSVLAVAALLWWQLRVPTGWVLPVVVALVFGHVGWSLGRRPVKGRAAAAAKTGPVSSLPARSSTPGQPDRATLGRYRIERELGRGAMGAVYLGRDPKIGRQVAIKTMALSREFAGDELVEARERFFREAETAGRLQHPDIVTIFDAGEDQELAYIAMEYLKGDDLQAYTQPAKLLPVPTVLRIVARVADALGHAHSQGVVHRDIKPANVMVDLAADAVKVTDFGIARVADSARTRTGMVLGTPSFMSPEQLAGRRVDGRSDLYSLGVMLFQLLTGRLPHRSDSMATLMHQIANEVPPDVRTLRPDLPEALAKVVAQLLEKRPEARYASGQQLSADLRAIVTRMQASGTQPQPLGPADVPPDSSGFAATVKMERADTGHNSSL